MAHVVIESEFSGRQYLAAMDGSTIPGFMRPHRLRHQVPFRQSPS